MASDDEFFSDVDSPHAGGGIDAVQDPEEWQDYHSEFLVAAWHGLKDHIASMGVYVLDACSFSDFTEFCFKFSSGRKPPC